MATRIITITRRSSYGEVKDYEVRLECPKCKHRAFDRMNLGTAFYDTMIEADPDEQADITKAVTEGDTDVGDGFEPADDWRCSECAEYASPELNDALDQFEMVAESQDPAKTILSSITLKE